MAFWQWSKTASLNSTADPTINWAEGQPPSSVNDSARALMARVAEYRDDINSSLPTLGTSTAYTISTNQAAGGNAFAATPNNGQLIAFRPHITNGLGATLAVDGGTAYPLYMSGGASCSPGTLIANTPYIASFNSSGLWLVFGLSQSEVLLSVTTGTNVGSLSDTTSFTSVYNRYNIELDEIFPASGTPASLYFHVFIGGVWQTAGYLGSSVSGDLLGGLGFSATNNGSVSGSLTLIHPSGTRRRLIWGTIISTDSVASYAPSYVVDAGATPITGVRVATLAGNITGTMRVYGRRSAI